MMRAYRLLDVFTERALTGNPLAVVLDAADLAACDMQASAAEFNLPEAVFVLPGQAGGRARLSFCPMKAARSDARKAWPNPATPGCAAA